MHENYLATRPGLHQQHFLRSRRGETERDHLVKVVFSALREKLEKHRVHRVEMAGGEAISSQRSPLNDKAVYLCLQQIEESRPIFLIASLAAHPGQYFDMVLTNPPFGKKSSVTFVTDEGEIRRESQNIVRDDFWTSTSNKQLNFVQHVRSILHMNGTAAVVVPDNVLFEGGAGEVVRRKLLHECDVHTLLRLPTGIFYAQGVKANVLFFDRKPASETSWTKQFWIYDLRTNMDFTLKTRPLVRADLDDFVACYHPENRHDRTPTWSPENPDCRWRAFTYDELMTRDKVNLDIFWLRDESLEDSANLPDPDILAAEIVDDLQSALEQFEGIVEKLKIEEG
jgi:type I restriction enzyme M protein